MRKKTWGKNNKQTILKNTHKYHFNFCIFVNDQPNKTRNYVTINQNEIIWEPMVSESLK